MLVKFLKYRKWGKNMLTYRKDNFEENLDDILNSVNKILNKTGDGYETDESKESDMLRQKKEKKINEQENENKNNRGEV